MILLIIGIILCIISIILLKKFSSIKVQKQKQIQQYNQFVNKQQIEKQKIKQQLDYLNYQYDEKHKDLKALNTVYQDKDKQYLNLISKLTQAQSKVDALYTQQKNIIDKQLEEHKKITKQAADIWQDNLEKQYERAEATYALKMSGIHAELQAAAASLDTLKQTRKAAYEAILREKQIKENKDNYRLLPSSLDLDDIHNLQSIRKVLHKPRVLSMLIWQTFWQPLAKEKFPVILQDKTKTGIYKITNLETDQSYIGQSVDVYKRWCQHCKAGLGIDAPAGNKLYKAIQQYGLQNFTFELLCQCPKEELNQKEKYFIELYQADLYGYNGTKGNK